jgi:hemerythrin-like domain-containing protein
MATVSLPTRAVPGLHTPAVGWEQPFEMLRACHERVQRMLELLERLQAHVARQGADHAAAQAAVDVMRYFDQAAPLHHLDEEEQVFPLALAQGDEAVQSAVARLQQEHGAMDAAWQALRAGLLQLSAPPPPARDWSDAWCANAAVQDFVALYRAHIAVEEGLVYPCVEAGLSPAVRVSMGQTMARRRGAV